jgi:acyl carrier protein
MVIGMNTTQALNKEDIQKEVSKIVSETLGIDPSLAKPDADFDDLGADSMDSFEIIMDIEDRFTIQIADGEAGACKTVGALVDLVCMKKGVVEPGARENWNPDKAES